MGRPSLSILNFFSSRLLNLQNLVAMFSVVASERLRLLHAKTQGSPAVAAAAAAAAAATEIVVDPQQLSTRSVDVCSGTLERSSAQSGKAFGRSCQDEAISPSDICDSLRLCSPCPWHLAAKHIRLNKMDHLSHHLVRHPLRTRESMDLHRKQ